MANKVHAYIRVSRDSQTVDQQKKAIQDSYPADTDFVWHEETASGWEGTRWEYEVLKKNIFKGWVKEVVVFSVSRLGRNVQEAAIFLSLCQNKNVRVKCLSENLDFSGPLGFALYALFAALAQMDSDTKSQRTKAKFDLYKEKDPEWQMHGSPPGCVSERTKMKAPEVYAMLDAGKSQKYIARMLVLTEHTVTKLVRLRGQELLTRKEYAERNPEWVKEHMKIWRERNRAKKKEQEQHQQQGKEAS